MDDFSSEDGASQGENAYMLYEEWLNEMLCEHADAVHELNPPMSSLVYDNNDELDRDGNDSHHFM